MIALSSMLPRLLLLSSLTRPSFASRSAVTFPAFVLGRARDRHHPATVVDNTLTLRPMSTTAASSESAVIPGPELPPVDPSAKRLFLVRHGEVINPGGDRPVYYGAMDVSLSPLGEEEATAAGQYLQQFDLEIVACSPLKRAIFGAERVLERQPTLKEQSTELLVLDGFKELDRGAWCGKTKDEISEEAMARFDACDESVTPEGGESYPFLKTRVLEARDAVLEQLSAGRAAAIVSHLQVTRSILSDALDIPTNEMSTLGVATASVTCIDYFIDVDSNPPKVHFQSFKPDVGLDTSKDGAN